MRNAGKFVQLLFLAVLVCVFNVAVVRAAGTSAFFDVTGYGAVADGKTLCTQAIQKTVDACHAAGGGTVYLPAGKYL
jgi:polygalacturonase